jgi:hypothetical protein
MDLLKKINAHLLALLDRRRDPKTTNPPTTATDAQNLELSFDESSNTLVSSSATAWSSPTPTPSF